MEGFEKLHLTDEATKMKSEQLKSKVLMIT